ncbi:hypothetical protein NQ314_020899 [Rhamnusium bicolor]|uniref:Calcium uniporter protein n=1 Tax=Rhamnusium bicolor TaxID=1586634 RepID=A0AAV8WJB5_9CUCU|nr:hypothetical protein NQ314_020899 [Rhamnusium bicolor]
MPQNFSNEEYADMLIVYGCLYQLFQRKNQLELVAHRRGNWLAWAGLGLMSVQFGILARLTWWEYSWDIMEPVTYFVTYGTAMACYAYFVLTKEEYVLQDVRDRQHLLIIHKQAKKLGLDLNQYNMLKQEAASIQYVLKKLRHPLKPKPTSPATSTTTGTPLSSQTVVGPTIVLEAEPAKESNASEKKESKVGSKSSPKQ